jgi:DNA segregation ATPase FtsK/SpoIIIE, S-DNA-T family
MKWTGILVPTPHRRVNELVGLILITVALLVGLSLVSFDIGDPSFNISRNSRFETPPVNLIGVAGSYAADLVFQAVGYAGFLVPVFLGLYAFQWFASSSMEHLRARLAGMFLMVTTVAAGLSLTPVIPRIEGQLPPGGAIGRLLADWLNATVNPLGTLIVLGACLLFSAILATTFTMAGAVRVARPWMLSASERVRSVGAWWNERARARMRARIEHRRAAIEERLGPTDEAGTERNRTTRKTAETAQPAEIVAEARRAHAVGARGAAPRRITPRTPEQLSIPVSPPARPKASPPANAGFPPPGLLALAEGLAALDEDELRERAELIEQKAREFGIAGRVEQINPGPVVTTFEFKPEPGIKISRVTSLGEDLCLALEAESIRIDRIAGKSTVGIEVPNPDRATIRLRELLESNEYLKSRALLPLALGKDIRGHIVVSDLHRMPHLLIAGSTGTGKSVSINSLVLSLLFRSAPERVKLIMVDPKRLELGLYQDIPHLLVPVVTEPVAAQNALKWAVGEMELRYKKLARRGVRTLEAYNENVRQLPIPGLGADSEEEERELPYIVIVIDELADLMMVASREVEESITRLAQMARAVGIHLILATQRPSVDVITGLIKANFPARISFRVASRVDSRTILDANGAESLLGRGDMLFLPPGSSRLMRAHGPMVTEEEVVRVADYLRAQGTPAYDERILQSPEERSGARGEPDGARDPLYDKAVRLVVEMGKASTSALQRRLRIGYGRAASLLDAMEADGIIGPPEGSRPREVLVKSDFFDEIDRRLQ